MTMRRPRGWKALLAMFIGGGAVAWHIMACMESPMSFAPNGDLAFTVMDPYDQKIAGNASAVGQMYRLMVLPRDGEIREIEKSRTYMISAPGYSPDGSQIAYFRLPLITKEDSDRFDALFDNREQLVERADTDSPEGKWIYFAPESFTPRSPGNPLKDVQDITLPPVKSGGMFQKAESKGGIILPAELVIRRVSSGEIVTTIPVDTLLAVDDDDGPLFWDYLLLHPQYGPDGRWIYFWTNSHAMAVDPSNGEKRLLAFPAAGGRLSPDGRTIATLAGKLLGIIQTDGTRATYVRFGAEPSLSGLAWAGNDALLVLGKSRRENTTALDIYGSDGQLIRSMDVPITGAKEENTGELTLSPDGKFITVSFGDGVFWMDFEGNVLASWKPENEGELLVQPTFTPDSRQVAFKFIVEEKTEGKTTLAGTAAIVFFTPEGRELSRVPVPRAEPPAPTEPQPSQQPQQKEQ